MPFATCLLQFIAFPKQVRRRGAISAEPINEEDAASYVKKVFSYQFVCEVFVYLRFPMARRICVSRSCCGYLCVCQDIVLDCCRFFCEENSRNIHEFADYAKAICDGQDTCCIYQRGKRVIVQNMVTFSVDLIFAILIQSAFYNIWRCSFLYNLLSVSFEQE